MLPYLFILAVALPLVGIVLVTARGVSPGSFRGQYQSVMQRDCRLHLLILTIVWFASTIYAWVHLDQGWVPHDEGALAHSAERVLQGELPHRDFDEIYTGGLSFVNAVAFRLFGMNLMSMRLLLFGVFLLWVPSVYYVASRFASPVVSGLVTLLGVTWSIPNYSAAVPSWFNLFLAVFSLAALLRFLETRRRIWLVLAGLSAGISILAKIVGLYLVAGALVALAFFEQKEDVTENTASNRHYSVILSLAAVLLVVALVLLVAESEGLARYLHFVVPGSVLAICLVWFEWRRHGGPLWSRIRSLQFYVAPFLAGIAVPLVVFLIPYIITSHIGDVVQGVFVLPARRFQEAAWPLPPLAATVFVLPVVFLLFVPRIRSSLALCVVLSTIALVLGSVLIGARRPIVAGMVWGSMRHLIPFTTLWGALILLRAQSQEHKHRQLMAVIAVTTMASLIQFPFSTPFYFLYVGPLAILSLTAVVSFRPITKPFFASLVAFYLLFAAGWLNSGHYDGGGDPHPHHLLSHRLNLERGGVKIASEEAREYEELIEVISEHSSGRYVLATPDCPEVYFLAGLRNPTRWIFEFLRAESMSIDMLMQTLREHEVNTVVINEKPRFSKPLTSSLRGALIERYPESARVGKFTVRWIP